MTELTQEQLDKVEVVKEEKWTNVQVDSQVLSCFMSCPQKMDYVFNRHLVPIGGVSKAIEKGTLSHAGLQGFWQALIDGQGYEDACKAGLIKAKDTTATLMNLGADDALEVYDNLIQFFKFNQQSTWMPLFVEQFFKIVAYEDSNLKLRIILTGRIDLGLRSPQVKLIPIDIKSEAERWFHSQMSNQFRIYCLACKTNILGVQRFGFQKSLEAKDKFKLEILPFDRDVLEEWRTETLPHYIKQLLICKEEGFYPKNHASCIHGHFACQFSDKYNGGICNVSREVREQKLSRYFTIGEPWDPSNI